MLFELGNSLGSSRSITSAQKRQMLCLFELRLFALFPICLPAPVTQSKRLAICLLNALTQLCVVSESILKVPRET